MKKYKVTFTRTYEYTEEDLKAKHGVAHAKVATEEAWRDLKLDIATGMPFAGGKDNFKSKTDITTI